ncbi:MAG: hypothetical protein R2746_00075 [Acidimicrobiales bacterium]
MAAVDALAIVASVVFLVRLLPQPLRLARSGVAEGVSALAALNAVVSALAWVAYGLQAGLPVVWGVSVLALGPGVWQTVLLRRSLGRGDLAGALAFVAGLVLAAVVGALGAALAVTVLVTTGPQVACAAIRRPLRRGPGHLVGGRGRRGLLGCLRRGHRRCRPRRLHGGAARLGRRGAGAHRHHCPHRRAGGPVAPAGRPAVARRPRGGSGLTA